MMNKTEETAFKQIALSYPLLPEKIALIEIQRPHVKNALCNRALAEIALALEALDKSDTKVVILTGNVESFAAGADIQELAAHDELSIKNDIRKTSWRQISAFSKPLLAAISGYCLGAGMELAMRADIRLAAKNAVFGQPEITLGIMPGAGGVQYCLQKMNPSLAAELLFSGKKISAEQAKQGGLVSAVFPVKTLLNEALGLASSIANKEMAALRSIKKAMKLAFTIPLQEALAQERILYEALFGLSQTKENIQKFFKKNKK